ncbi:MAG TPA: VWA domain-containing protein [Candidatus Paceibacterota bacterium]|nr:VWA domain-containing protein [Verrucomicrobiota bacterium]HOX02960.1 VWA domain-containing protein [Verrucomicrobiota bacterium]HRZ45712.1 VWA domain-containing protein [Candidatus Paceibacterota bacterium]
MNFGAPDRLHLLWIVLPPLCLFLAWAWRRKQRDITRFIRSRLLAQLTVGVSLPRQKIRLALLVLAIGCILLALARPRWGHTLEEARQRGLDILLAIDTSRSMLAQDVTPSRIERARLALLDLIPLASTDRLGLVVFAESAFLQCPLTVDDEAFRQNVRLVEVGALDQASTSLAAAIQTAAASFPPDSENEKILILVTDGEDHDQRAVEAAQAAAQAGIRIFTVGAGTPEGDMIRISDSSGHTSFLKDPAGNVVKSRLNEPLLQEIAQAGQGFYLPLRGADTMESLYRHGLAPLLPPSARQLELPTSESGARLVQRPREQFQWPLALALVFLIAEFLLPDRRPAPSSPELAPSAISSHTPANPSP